MTMMHRFSTLMLPAVLVMALSNTIASKMAAADPAKGISATSKAIRDQINLKTPDGCSHIYGFNYQPSWGHNGLTVWGEKFDAKKYREELAAGKKYFPKFNTVRMWLSWSAYRADAERFLRNFQTALDICGELDLLVIPVISSRWPGNPLWDRVEDAEISADFDTTFGPFVRALVTPRKGDQRILAWDLCNEPGSLAPITPSGQTELQWLTRIRDAVKNSDPTALVCIGTMPGTNHLINFNHLQDILTPHLYYPLYLYPYKTLPAKLQDSAVQMNCITDALEMAAKLGKPVLCTECCWGPSVQEDDAERAEIVRINLQALKQYKIGFLAHALYASGVADLHTYKNLQDGLYMPFILEDGSLRPGHDVYNEFTK